mmetsp:Transcript_116830/g.174424  ORF Transcript_116830/g.174424 Transcript_116830/m.174424 type:complete len:226 (-) Transcript_116830:1585-2262(-)
MISASSAMLLANDSTSRWASRRTLSRVGRKRSMRLAWSCSRVWLCRLTLGRTERTMTTCPSCRCIRGAPIISKLVAGGNSTSFSPGYCESRDMSAPLSTCASSICSTIGFEPLLAYFAASASSKDVDMNATSTPPLLPIKFSKSQRCGSSPFDKPRKTTRDEPSTVLFRIFMVPEISIRIVTLYSGFLGLVRRTLLYFSNIGPVYSMIATTSTKLRSHDLSSSSS